jgi:hypothetical protein
MKEFRFVIAAAIVALALALFIFVRILWQKSSFDRVVIQAQLTTEGYDQRLIEMVTSLEEELSLRASFGYKGGKDPMTGKTRAVVMPTIKPVTKGARRARNTETAATQTGPAAPAAAPDNVRLTAIIFDDGARMYTAIVMDGERSLSVQVGDKVSNRVVTKITAENLFMENAATMFKYDIFGNSATQPK